MSMLEKISYKITMSLFKDIGVNENEKAWIAFAIEAILGGIATTGIMVLISIITHSVICLLLFNLFFIPLRQYTGGYHEKTHLSCLILTNTVYLLTVILKIVLPIIIFTPLYIIEVILGLFTIFLCCPVRNENKVIEESKVYKYKFFSVIIFIIENILVYFIYTISPVYAIYTTNILNIVIISIVIGKITERRIQNG